MKKNLIIFPFLLFLSVVPLKAQNTLSGVVTDAETGEPVAGVNVYLSNTQFGDATDKDGYYKFNINQTGVFDLVFSFVGYKRVVKSIRVANNSNREINASLKPDTQVLDELQITSSNKEWKRNFEHFRDEFIGETDFAYQTSIENPTVLSFDIDEQQNALVATSPEPIIINNKALGYRLYIELEQFVWNRSGNSGFYKIYPKFEQLTPEDNKQRRKWERNREKTYEKSFRRFLNSLYNDELKENNFSIINPSKIIPLEGSEKKFILIGRPGVSPDKMDNLKGYKLTDDLVVNYGRPSAYSGSRAGNSPFDTNRSTLIPRQDDKVFFIDKDGILLNPVSLEVRGYWGQFRIGDLLPSYFESE